MSARKAKLARKALKELLIEVNSKSSVTIPEHVYLEKEHPTNFTTIKDLNQTIKISSGTKKVDPKSTRGIYLQLKKEVKIAKSKK